MVEYKREYPLYALCGLNCGLCPRYHTDGDSKCPGCGGPDFHIKHPACPVLSCNRKNDNVEYCHQCSKYPCKKYSEPSPVDSFITYRNVISDFDKARKNGIENYKNELNRKVEILERLLKNYNDGKRKNLYCLAVNLLSLPELEEILAQADTRVKHAGLDSKQSIQLIIELLQAAAAKNNIELKLRK